MINTLANADRRVSDTKSASAIKVSGKVCFPYLFAAGAFISAYLPSSVVATSLLPEIIVTANTSESGANLALDTWITDQADIEARNALTISEALTQVPGLNVQYGASSGEARAWIRGFRDRETLVLYDGIPIASAYDGTVDLAEVSSQGVSQIRVIKSAPSVIYGINGLSGVVDINPAAIPELPETSVRLQVGSSQNRTVQVAASRQFGSVGSSLHISQERQKDFPLPDNFTRSNRLNSDFDRRNFRLRLGHDGDAAGKTSLLLLRSSNSKGLPPELYTDDPNYERLNKATQRIAALTHQLEDIPVSVKVYESSYDYVLDEYALDDFVSILDTERADARTRGAQVYGHFEPSALGRLTASLTATQEVLTRASAIDINIGNKSRFINTALEYDFAVSDQLQLLVGGIVTYFKSGATTAKSKTAWNPQMAVEWAFSSDLAIRFSAAQRARFPKLVELFDPRYGNPNVTEAESNNIDVTIDWRPSNRWRLSSAIYQYDIQNLIEKPTRRSPYSNVPAVDIKGVELTAVYSPSNFATLQVSGSEIRAVERLDSGERRQLRSRPQTSLLVQGDIRVTHSFSATLSGTYTDKLFDIDDFGLYREVKTGWTFNATMHYQVYDDLRIYAEVANANDTYYEHKIGFPRPARQFNLGLHYDF